MTMIAGCFEHALLENYSLKIFVAVRTFDQNDPKKILGLQT